MRPAEPTFCRARARPFCEPPRPLITECCRAAGEPAGGNSSISVGPGGRALNSSVRPPFPALSPLFSLPFLDFSLSFDCLQVVDYLNPARRTDRGVEQVPCLSLAFHCPFHCLSWTFHCPSLTFHRCTSTTRSGGTSRRTAGTSRTHRVSAQQCFLKPPTSPAFPRFLVSFLFPFRCGSTVPVSCFLGRPAATPFVSGGRHRLHCTRHRQPPPPPPRQPPPLTKRCGERCYA